MAYSKKNSDNDEVYYFPKHDIDPKKKDKEWILAYLKAFYQDDLHRGGSLFYNSYGRYANVLRYSMGQQSIGQYKAMLGCDDTERSFINTNWDIVPIMPKFIDVVVGNMQKQGYNVECNPIDPTSINAEKQAKHKLRANVMLQKEMAKIQDLMGIEFGGPDQQLDPKTFEEIDLHMDLNYKQEISIDMEEALALILELNDWDSISEHLDRDLVMYGCAITKDYIGANGLPKVRRVNPEKFKTMYSKTPNFKACGGYGELVTMTAAEFELKAGRKFTRDEKQKIHEQFSRNSRGVSNFNSSDRIDTASSSGDYRFGSEFDDLVITIFDAEFSSTNTDYYEKKANRFGNTTTYKRPYGYKAPKDSKFKRKVQQDEYAVWYKAMWIVGTEFLFNYGLATDMKISKSSYSEAISSYHVNVPAMTNMNTISLAERMIPVCDDIQINIVKLRMAVARARVKGIKIEIGALENIPKGSGGEVFKPLEVVAMYNESGNLLYRRLDDEGRQQGDPVTELENGMARDVMNHITIINFKLGLLRDATGINEVADASTPNPDIGKAVAELAIQSTNNSLEGLYKARKFMFTETAYSLTLRLQDSVENKTIKGHAKALGSMDAKFIEVNKKIRLHEFGIIVEDRPTQLEWQDYEANLRLALQEKQITVDHYYFARNIKNLKMAQKYLAFVVKQKREEDQQLANQQIQANGEEQRASAAQTTELETQKITHETNEKIRLETAKAGLEVKLNEEKHLNKLEELRVEHHIHGDLKDVDHRHENRHREEDREAEQLPESPAFKEAPSTVAA